MKVLLAGSLIAFIGIQIFGSYSKKNTPLEILVDYQKTIRPKFIRLNYLSQIPFLVIFLLILTSNIQLIASYKYLLIFFSIIIDSLSLYFVIKAFNSSDNVNQIKKIRTSVILIFTSKALMVISLILYLSYLLK